MVLNIDDKIFIDIDKVSAVSSSSIIVDGFKLMLNKEDIETVRKAYIWQVRSYMYDKNLKKYKWGK